MQNTPEPPNSLRARQNSPRLSKALLTSLQHLRTFESSPTLRSSPEHSRHLESSPTIAKTSLSARKQSLIFRKALQSVSEHSNAPPAVSTPELSRARSNTTKALHSLERAIQSTHKFVRSLERSPEPFHALQTTPKFPFEPSRDLRSIP